MNTLTSIRRSTVLKLGLLFVLGLWFDRGCVLSRPAKGSSPKMKMVSEVSLNVHSQIDGDRLTIDYRVRNDRPQPIYLVNRVHQWTKAGFSVDPNLIYTQIENQTLKLTKAYLDLPENIDVEAPEIPFLTEVASGGEFEETIVKTLPLKPYHPYNLVVSSQSIHRFNAVQFVLGWLPREGLSVKTVAIAPYSDLLSVTDWQDLAKSQQLEVVDLDLDLPTLMQPL
jgi:hypothetical protein